MSSAGSTKLWKVTSNQEGKEDLTELTFHVAADNIYDATVLADDFIAESSSSLPGDQPEVVTKIELIDWVCVYEVVNNE